MKLMKSKRRLNKVMAIGHLFTTPHHSAKKKNNTKQTKLTKRSNWRRNRTVVGRWYAGLFACLFLFLFFIYLVIHHLVYNAATSASPSWVLYFQDGVTLLLFLVSSSRSALFPFSKCNLSSISSFLTCPPAVEHTLQRNMKENSRRGLKTNTRGSACLQGKAWKL